MKLLLNPIVLLVGVFTTTIILVNIFIKPPRFSSLTDMITYAKQVHNYSLTFDGELQLVNSEPTNIDYNHDVMVAEYNYELAAYKISPLYYDNFFFLNDYSKMTEYSDSTISDIGFYCKGLYQSLSGNYKDALKLYYKVKNHRLKYLNASMGFCYLKLGDNNEAEELFNNEITLNGDIQNAYENLFSSLLYTRQYDKIGEILQKKGVFKYIDNESLSQYYFATNAPVNYFATIVKKIYLGTNVYGFTAALLIVLFWAIFLRQADIFEPEKWLYIGLTITAGSLGYLFAFPLFDFEALKLGLNINGSPINDFLYNIFGIGMIEEFIKIVPLLLLAKFTKIIKEPIDYVLYACFSALGFAFIENLLSLDYSHLYIINIRAIIVVVVHMFCSAFIGYGIAQQKLFPRRNKYLNFLLFLFLAAIAHGIYSFIYSKMYGSYLWIFYILYTCYVSLMISTFNNFINNTLNLSSFLKKDDSLNLGNLQDMLVCSLSLIVLYEYLALSFKFGPSYSNSEIIGPLNTGSNINLILFVSLGVSSIDLNKGMWDNPFFPKFSRRPGLSYLMNKSVTILPKPMNYILTSVLPMTGVVVRRLTIGDQSDYLVIKLDSPLDTEWFITHVNIHKPTPDYILVKGTDSDSTLSLGYKQGIYFITISELCDPMKDNLTKAQINLIDYAFLG